MGDGGSGLEELLVHLGAEGFTGGQCPAHKLLCHVPAEGATCFQVLGSQGESICSGRGAEGPCLVPAPSPLLALCSPGRARSPCPATHPTGRARRCWAGQWGCCCTRLVVGAGRAQGGYPPVGRGLEWADKPVRGWCQEKVWPERGWEGQGAPYLHAETR